MARGELRPGYLGAGEFYGSVPGKRVVGDSILSEVRHKASVDVPGHSHELAYFTLILGGAYSEKFGSRTSFHEPMSVLWHRSGIYHKDRIGSGGGRFFTVEVRPDTVESLREYRGIPPDLAEQSTDLVWLATRLFHEFKNWHECSELIAEGLVLEMLGACGRHAATTERQPPNWLNTVVEKLNDEFTAPFSSSELAETARVHPIHLAAVFRKFHRQTIGEYVQQRRVSHASKLLIEGDLPLADVAFESGFSDQSHLNRIFKRYTGVTPGAFRGSLR
jgi:AraC family transcriptional regulator